MKILHVIDTCNPKTGGPIEGIKQLNYFYLKNKIYSEILSNDTQKSIKKFKKNLPKINPVGPKFSIYSINYSLIKWLKKNVKRFDCIIVHGLWHYHNYAVWKIAKSTNIPYFVFSHGSLDPWFNYTYPLKFFKKKIFWFLFQKKFLEFSKSILFTSLIEKKLAMKAFNFSNIKPQIVKYGIIGNPIKKKFNFIKNKKKKIFLSKKKILLYLGRVQEKKGIDILIKSFIKLQNKKKNYLLVICGPTIPIYQKYLKSLIPKNKNSEIIFLNPLYHNDKWRLLNSSFVFCSPSHQENFGISIVEALSSKIPVITTTQVNIYKKIKNYKAGLISKDNYNSFTNILNSFLKKNNNDYLKMSANAYKCFNNEFNAKNFYNSFIKIIKSKK